MGIRGGAWVVARRPFSLPGKLTKEFRISSFASLTVTLWGFATTYG
jgi:hypothetical protein